MPVAPKLSLVTPAQQSPSPASTPTKKQGSKSGKPTKALIESQLPGSKLAVGNRMYLHTGLSGERSWRWAYRLFDAVAGKDRQFEVSLGEYPATDYSSADAARAKAWSEHVQLGKHPPQHRTSKARAQAELIRAAQAETVWQLLEQWLAEYAGEWVPSYALQVRTYMERYFGPHTEIGNAKYAAVERNAIVIQLRGIREGTLKPWDEKLGKYAAMARATPSVSKLCKVWLNAAFEYACDEGLLKVNPIANVRMRKKKADAQVKNSPVMNPEVLRRVLADMRAYGGDRRTKLMLLLLAHTCVRSTELRDARWTEFDLKAGQWTIPGERMKMKRLHKVPLSFQAVALLRELQGVSGTTGLLFPNENNPLVPMPQSTAREALYRITKREFSPHSFRSTFSTLANEAEVADPHIIDAVLAHRKSKGNTGAEGSYNQSTYHGGRTALMQAWSSYLESLVTGPALPK